MFPSSCVSDYRQIFNGGLDVIVVMQVIQFTLNLMSTGSSGCVPVAMQITVSELLFFNINAHENQKICPTSTLKSSDMFVLVMNQIMVK